MAKDSKHDEWLNSKEARSELEVSACDLSHIREAGALRYRKDRNAYRYLKRDVQNLRNATLGEEERDEGQQEKG